MYIEVTETMFKDAFRSADRLDNFSHEALGMLYDYLDNIEEETGQPVELDVIAICCDFEEADVDEIRSNYSLDDEQDVEEYLQDNTLLIGETSSGYVFVTF